MCVFACVAGGGRRRQGGSSGRRRRGLRLESRHSRRSSVHGRHRQHSTMPEQSSARTATQVPATLDECTPFAVSAKVLSVLEKIKSVATSSHFITPNTLLSFSKKCFLYCSLFSLCQPCNHVPNSALFPPGFEWSPVGRVFRFNRSSLVCCTGVNWFNFK